jgi:hypothetical protein
LAAVATPIVPYTAGHVRTEPSGVVFPFIQIHSLVADCDRAGADNAKSRAKRNVTEGSAFPENLIEFQ